MKARIWTLGVAVCLVLAGTRLASAATYYVNNDSTVDNVYTTGVGNDGFPGTDPAFPKRTLNNLIGTTTLNPGDIVYIDTGTYASGVVISNTVAGSAGNPILFRGSTNTAAGGSLITGSGINLRVEGSYLHFADLRVSGGSEGVSLNGASFCEFERIQASSNTLYSYHIVSSPTNAFRRCVAANGSSAVRALSGAGNYFENCVLLSPGATALRFSSGVVSNMVGCVIGGVSPVFISVANMSIEGSRNLFAAPGVASDIDTMADLGRMNPTWRFNQFADPLFVNVAALDFHVVSASGYISNGVWVTNGMAYSPAIDFGSASSTAWTNEPDPNGGRVNVGLYGGTAEASKSRSGVWTFALAFNDGGTLIQTGRLEWVASTNLSGLDVALEYTTNQWATTNVIATVPATNEQYNWAPSFSYPSVQWRVRDPASGVASTNAKPFSIRHQATNTFAFYVNDTSLTDDVYGMGLGSRTNDGAAASRPKRHLAELVEAYQLRGGDTIYIDTGTYLTNATTTMTAFDSGTAGNPIRILGSPNGSVLNRGSTSADVLDLAGASHLEFENLRLTGGRYGLNGGVTGITMRNVEFTGNQQGVVVSGSGHVLENCLAADNSVRGLWATGTGANQWRNGVVWNNPVAVHATSNSLSVSNSILGRGTTLLGNQVMPGNHNVVWDTAVGASYATLTDLQSGAHGMGWNKSVYADPLFADADAGDYHLQSVMGRINPATGLFETNDLVHSPAIDFGDPLSMAYTNEPNPNGTRLNAGLYGGTTQASKSRTNAWVQLLSYNDGGTLDAQAGATLRWDGGNFDPGDTVTLWLSRDGGESWEELASGITASDGSYAYQELGADDSSSFFGQLKVELDGSDPAVDSQSSTNFTYRNGTFSFYLNDSSTAGDVYCSAIGNDANLGTSAGAPMANLHALLDKYGQFSPGDRIYIDTGVYASTNTIVLAQSRSGVATNPVTFFGSTNRLAGGSVFSGGTLKFDFRSGVSNIVLRDVVVSGVARGVAMTNAVNILLDGVEVRSASSRAFDLQANTRDTELLRCVAHGGAVGVYLANVTNVAIRHGVFWQQTGSGIQGLAGVGATIENSILASTNLQASLLNLASVAGMISDFNGLHAGANTYVGTLSGSRADNLAAWQALSGGLDVRSIPGDPRMANPGPAAGSEFAYDYHLKTEQTLGRLRPDGTRTSDPLSSPLLNAGNPATTTWTNEPAPNGERVNIGRWGGTEQASIASTIPWLRTVSYGDAGSVTDSVVSLVWTAGGVSNETADVEVSVDGGKTWSVSVTNGVPITNGLAAWTVSGLPDTPGGAWRIVCIENTNLWAQSTNFFAIRNTHLQIFVATADTNEAVYVNGPGLADNWMATSNAPINSLRTVFERFDLEPGDQVYVDTGTYIETDIIRIGMKNSGTTGNPVRVTGNPAIPYRGTVLARNFRTVGANAIQLDRAGGVAFESLMVSNAWIGISAENTGYVDMERVRVGHVAANGLYMGAATHFDLGHAIVDYSLQHGLLAHTGSVGKVRHSLFQNNGVGNVNLRGGSLEIKNSILEATGPSRYVYYWEGGGALNSDYNNIRASEGANVAGGPSRLADRFLIDWQISNGFANDVSSFGYDPQFADAATRDFHLKSEHGRWVPALGDWTNDTVTSRLIDLGDPASPYVNEPVTNGGRVNVGLYGNTAEASRSSGEGTLVPLTMSDGGTVRGTVELFWAWNGLSPVDFVYVQFSGDGGGTWTNIAPGAITADNGTAGYSWATTNFASTAQGVWRVMTTNGAVVGQTETLFAVKNDPLAYYINDGSTEGDVYCTAAGSSGNTGLSSNSPLNSIETLLNRYKVEHGDVIYIDTGVYPRSSPLVIALPAVAPTNRLVIQGSTNEAAGGTILTNSSGAVLELRDMLNVDLRDLRLHGGSRGLLLTQSSSNQIVRVRSVGASTIAFDLGLLSDQNEFIRCAALNFSQTGLAVAVARPLEPASTNHWRNGVIASRSSGATSTLVGVRSGALTISNSVLAAFGPQDTVYHVSPGVMKADYNAYHRAYSDALFARADRTATFGVQSRQISYLNIWQAWSGGDSNSLSADPLFADLDAGDLYPRSQGGRYVPDIDDFEDDADTSPLIDTADPAMDWSLETPPNGGRANIGLYGGTVHASRTPTNGAFVLLSLNDGGVVRGGHTLKWSTRGVATNAGVNLFLSTNSGASYQNIGSAPASAREYVWDSTTNATTPFARWRIQSAAFGQGEAASSRDFLIHNTNITFYVNDSSTSNDVYTTAAGSTNHTGLSPSSPLPSLAEVLSRFDLEPGDRVLIDTGDYSLTQPTVFGYLDSGTAANPVVVQGSTNHSGTVFLGAGIQLANAMGIEMRDIRFLPLSSAMSVKIQSSEDILLDQVDSFGGGDGFQILRASNVLLRNVSAAYALSNGVFNLDSFNTRLEFGTIWSNGLAQVAVEGLLQTNSSITVSNSVLGAFGIRTPIYRFSGGTLSANHNNLYLSGGALASLSFTAGFPREYDSVGKWTAETGQDSASLSHLPRFANPAAGDFHLKSSAGRFDPETGGFVATDPPSENSPLIDAGAPSIPPAFEPDPNGGRVNIGRYGNTPEASKTPTNGALTLISFNDGGRAVGDAVPITWLARGAVTNGTVTISYSADGGGSWIELTNGIAATDGSWLWDSTSADQTVQGLLRIDGSDGSSAQNSQFFSVRNDIFRFYINDNSTVGDIYCTAVGNNLNSGLTNSAPMASLNALLAKYDLEGGDIVYIDTGRYTGIDPWRITQSDSAGSLELDPVIIQGATNGFPSGTVLDRGGSPVGIQVDYAVGVSLRNITVSNTVGQAVVFNNSFNVAAEEMAVGNANLAFSLNGGSQLRVTRSAVYDSNRGVTVGDRVTSIPNMVFPVIENSVFWEMQGACIQLGNIQITARNNILSVGPGHYVYELAATSVLDSDYNAIWLPDGGRVLRRIVSTSVSPVPVIYDTLGAWAAASGQDLHSYDGDPSMANPTARNFRLKSQGGRWVPGSGSWTNDPVSSPLIDAGDPSYSVGEEPAPNGARVNVGLFGGDSTASKTPTNSALHLLTLNRGGVASGQVALNWRASGLATGHTVRVLISLDNGENWLPPIVTNLAASLGGVTWNSLAVPSSPVARWRVQSEQDTNVVATSELIFVLNNQPIAYYVNDESTAGDIYCSAVGSTTNTGLSPSLPKRWISEIVDAYDLEAGDVIYVDTGYYQADEPTVFGDLDAGGLSQDPALQITIQGSTNQMDGGSLFVVTDPEQNAFVLTNTYGIRFRHLNVIGASNGVSIQNSYSIAGDWLNVRDGVRGVSAGNSSNLVFSHCVFSGHREEGILFSGGNFHTLNVGSSVMWSNRYGIYLQRGYAFVSNSIMGMLAPDAFGYRMEASAPNTEFLGNHNSLYVGNPAAGVALYRSGSQTTAYYSVSAWTRGTGNDAQSLPHDPLLADPGAGDFHLKSQGGRWQSGTGWVVDGESSPLIDAGRPGPADWTVEPDPNGRRRNIGLYGGTAEASKSPLSGWLTLISLNDGGAASGTVDLQWTVGGAATNYSVCLEYSPDNGITWTNIVCGWPASLSSYSWDSVPYGRSALSLWRAYCVEDPSIDVVSQAPFLLRNGGAIPYYVNDANTNDTVYCTAPGDDANNGLTPATPKASLQAIIDAYALEPEDIVYVDSGLYFAGAPPIRIDQRDSGWSNLFVTIQGSTNPASPTVFWGSSFGVEGIFSFDYAENIRLRDLTIRNANTGVVLNESTGCVFDNVRIENNRSVGVSLTKSNIRLVRSVLWKNASATGGVAVALSTASAAIENCVVWGHPTPISGSGSDVSVTNSVLEAIGANGRIYNLGNGGIYSVKADYNSYWRRNGALIAEDPLTVGGSDFYNDLPTWTAATGADQHSMAMDPLFANEIGGDFHPKSSKGRYQVGFGWTNDPPGTNSPLIDAGAPSLTSTNEPDPNGGIINIGAYGNTPQASMTQTNPPWLRTISYNEAGSTMTGDALLYWVHGGMPSNTPVTLRYSVDYEVSWVTIASNIPAGTRQYLWNVADLPLTLALVWSVSNQVTPGVWDVSDNPVAVKTTNYNYYINDGSTNGNIYTTAPGQPWDPWISRGTNPAAPLRSLKDLLDHYPVSGGDVIYIDTGTYPVTSTNRIIFNERNMGTALAPLIIHGSTNRQEGGTLLQGDGTADGILFQNTRHMEMNDLRIAGAQSGLVIANVDTIRMKGVEIFNNLTNGISASGTSALEIRNSLLYRNGQYGIFSSGAKGVQALLNCTVWGNRQGAAWNGVGGLTISNSILVSTNAAFLYTESGAGTMGGNHNLLWMSGGGAFATNARDRVAYSDLNQWQKGTRDLRSLVMDPLLVDPAAGNFHLQSREGYWSNGVSANTSWAIDAGNPLAAAYTNEPAPNGSRLNLGAYGGTPYASKSDSSLPELLAVSLRDGGGAPELQPLYWLARGLSPTNTVRIDYSPDNGDTWVTLEAGVGIGNSPYDWFSAANPTPEAWWRVVLEADTNVYSEAGPFVHRPSPLTYFVNDDSLVGDVYTTAIGSVTNRGYVSNSPLHSIQAVLERYQLSGGDEIRVDTGVYALEDPVFISTLNGGTAGNPVRIIGSTNLVDGGSRLEPAVGMDEPALIFFTTRDIELSWFRIGGFTNAIAFQGQGSSGCTFLDLDVQASIGPGISLDKASGIRLERVVVRDGLTNGISAASSTFALDGCVVWSNQASALAFGDSVTMEMTNTVLEASGPGQYCYLSPTSSVIRANHNNLVIRDGAQIALFNGVEYRRLPQWTRFSAQDRHSISADPLFHDPANGDFHPRSVAGRYQYGVGWTNDVPDPELPDFSPMIDMGSPQTAWSNEPTPNGNRRNIGLHGNTWQASKSDTNRWVQAITAMGGGLAYGGFNLTWGYGGGIGSNETVRLEYSWDNGTSNWIVIADVAVGSRQHYWQSDLLQAGIERWMTSPAARWRIFLLSDTNVVNMIPTYFGLRNSPFKYYLNDESLVNDMYATAIGNDANLGFYPAAPKLTMQNLLENVDLEPTDQVYVDTGFYYMVNTNNPILWQAANSGGPGEPVLVRGSTHADGSWFIASNYFPAGGIFFMNADDVDMQDLNFRGGNIEFIGEGLAIRNLSLTNGNVALLSNVSVYEDIRVDRGSVALSGTDNYLERMHQRWGETVITGTNVVLQNSVVFTTNNLRTALVVNAVGVAVSNNTIVAPNGSAVAKRGGGTLRLGHNILVAGGTDANSVINWLDGGLVSDWNNLLARGSAWIGSYDGKWEKLAYWQAASGQDANSVSFEPLFQNESAGDFHLNSMGGRWSPIFSDWDYGDSEHSPVIDLGNPWVTSILEPLPSGYRRNLGAYGNTAQASKSRTNLWVTALTMNDGGVLKGTNVILRWAGPAAGHTNTFTLQYTADGSTWLDIATGLSTAQGTGTYVWDTSGFPDSFDGLWRVISDDASVADTNDTPFALRNFEHEFYVNDADTTDDVYCSAIGSDANDGLTPATPKRTIQALFDMYDLEGGDTVYVDTGSYPSASDVRMIWSRSGSSNAPVVIQGNPDGPYTLLTRTGSTGFPAVGLDVKASDVELRDLAIQGINRGMLLESNRNVVVEGATLIETSTGISALGVRGLDIRNSALWKTDVGVQLTSTRTSVLENLTFALPTQAGIQMLDTVADTFQNNIFVPAEGAYAYSIGTATSLLENAFMDYNLYDFGNEGSGFFAEWTNDLRRWQLTLNNDFRSALTDANLVEVDYPGDLHPLSEYGRWTTGGWVQDATTSWAVDHGNPESDFALEEEDNGGRINIGRYGNTAQASQGDTNVYFEIRTVNEPALVINLDDPLWPLVWSTHLVDDAEWVLVQFSGDGGGSWSTLATVPAYQEYHIWQATIQFATIEGRWRVIGVNDTNLVQQNDYNFTVRPADLSLHRPYPVSGLMRFDWEGGVQGPRYQVLYSDDFGVTWNAWDEKYNGPDPINKSSFVIASGESKLIYVFEDRTSYLQRQRWYTIVPYYDTEE